MSFLKAEWRKLAIANYAIDQSLLSEYLPFGTVLDLWNGKCYVSLVGFMFLNTRLLGIKIPYHANFEEVNLRFYVKRFDGKKWKRGVVFVKEIVPKPALTFVANSIYNENYETLPMKHRWEESKETRMVEYQWKKGDYWNSFKVIAGVEAEEIVPDSEAEFITEHYWGYARINDKTSNEYEVTHPKWKMYDVRNFEVDVDFNQVYGAVFKGLNVMVPDSVMLAEGSEITVEKKTVINKVFK